jgi:hypothetical protein
VGIPAPTTADAFLTTSHQLRPGCDPVSLLRQQPMRDGGYDRADHRVGGQVITSRGQELARKPMEHVFRDSAGETKGSETSLHIRPDQP